MAACSLRPKGEKQEKIVMLPIEQVRKKINVAKGYGASGDQP
jgi:hypothetical protein